MTINEAYRILGLGRDATPAELKSAYRRLVAGAHPDRGGEAAEFIRIRAAYEVISSFLEQGAPEDDIAIPADLRTVIDSIVSEFWENRRWAEAEVTRRMDSFESRMSDYIRTASRAELRRVSVVFRDSWNATITALCMNCNSKCDDIIRSYESWYTESTQAVFDEIHRREVRRFLLRRRFWEAFVLLMAFAGALTVVVGWGGPVDRWISIAVLATAAAASFLYYRWWCRRRRRKREAVEPLSVAPFELEEGACLRTEGRLRRGRRTTGAMGAAGLLLGNAASGGLAIPVVGALAGLVLGGVLDRLVNPTELMREGMREDLQRFMTIARPQVTAYVLEAHETLLADVQDKILANYQTRVKYAVRLLTAGDGSDTPAACSTAGGV